MAKFFRGKPAPDASLWIVAPWLAVSFVLAFAVWRGTLLALPVLIAAAFLLSPTPWLLLGAGVLLYALILVSAAVSGLVFAAVGPPLLRVPWIGTFAAFTLSALPYTAALGYAIEVARGAPWRSIPGREFLVVAFFVAMVIGGIFAAVRRSDAAPTGDDASDSR